MSPPDVSIVVPAFCTRDSLEPLCSRLAATLEAAALSFEIVVVDDACPEGSAEVARGLAARDGRIRVLAHAGNRGQHRAVVTGMAAARGTWVVSIDGDLQDPPEAIPALVARAREGFDIVFAGRRGRYETWGRRTTSKIFKRTLHHLTGVPADAGLFVLVSQRAAEGIVARARGRASVIVLAAQCGLPMTSIPVERQVRPTGRSAYSAFGRLRSGVSAVGWIFRSRVRRGGAQ